MLKQYIGAMVLTAVALSNAMHILPWYVDQDIESHQKPTATNLKIMLSNVRRSNKQYDAVVSAINAESPDIVVLQEVNQRWVSQLTSLEKDYQNKIIVPKPNHFGIAIFSRYPLSGIQEVYWAHNEIPSIIAKADIEGKGVTIVATHPPPPMSVGGLTIRNKQLEAIGQTIAGLKGHAVLIGDLNVTMWSAYYKNLERISGLQNARRGFGILNTWPVRRMFPSIPIDHILVSDEVRVKDFRVLESVGSDHLPIVATLSLDEV